MVETHVESVTGLEVGHHPANVAPGGDGSEMLSGPMAKHIALLRGINLGPSRRVAMADLRELCSELGHEHVRTYVQSGNVVLTSKAKPERVARDLERAIADKLGVETDVIVRTRDELAGVIERNPIRERQSVEYRLVRSAP